jgi:predicted nucleic acid-binding protein
VLVAGVAGFKRVRPPANPSAQFLRRWLERDTFLWLTSEDVLAEYREVLLRLGVRHHLIGRVLNLLAQEAEFIDTPSAADESPDPGDAPFWACATTGRADFIVTLNPKDFPQEQLSAKIIGPADAIPHRRPSRREKRS